jgi:hypothetical protein
MKNEILSFVGNWMELENIILSEVSQTQKAKSLMFSLTYGIQTYKNVATLRNTGHTEGKSCMEGAGKLRT